jgi:lipopolysaccharide transport system permease protein
MTTTTNVREIRPGDPGGAEGTPADAAGATATQPRVPVVRVEARPGWIGVNLRELWQFRDLLGFLASRDIKVRYKQTVLGVAWAIVQPALETLAWFALMRLGGVQLGGAHYLVFTYAAMLVWKLFENALTQASNSLVSNQQLLTKVYFPRLIIPAAAVLSGLMDFAIASVLMIPLMAYFKIALSAAILLLPLFVLFTIVAALSVGLWLSALNVQYRDVRYVVPFLVRIWFLASPIVYSASAVPEKWRLLYGLNPMAGVASGFRWALLGGEGPGGMLWVSVATTLVLLVGGLFYFRRMEKTFADIV